MCASRLCSQDCSSPVLVILSCLRLQEKEEEERRVAAALAARDWQQQQQHKAQKKQQQQLAQGRPGIGAVNTGVQGGGAAGRAPAAVVVDGNVQGVIHRSKWSQRARQ
jgi:hypothetical protein